jgi:hypothetical protein
MWQPSRLKWHAISFDFVKIDLLQNGIKTKVRSAILKNREEIRLKVRSVIFKIRLKSQVC